MPAPLNLLDFFQKGIPEELHLATGDDYILPDTERWLILGGTIDHITGTDSTLAFSKAATSVFVVSPVDIHIPAATASAFLPLYGNATGRIPFIDMIEAGTKIDFDGGAGSEIWLQVLKITVTKK